MENAYWPTKLAFENFGGGGGGVPLPRNPPPHPATKTRRSETAKARRFTRLLIVHFHWSILRAALEATLARRRSPEDAREVIV
jgi:hypothetical protein